MSSVLQPTPDAAPDALEFEDKLARAEAALEALLLSGAPTAAATSFGKDSSVVLNLLLTTAARLRAKGHEVAPIVVMHADTRIENPEMVRYAHREMAKVRAYAKKHDLQVRVEIAAPNLSDMWAVRVIGGRALPPYPGSHRDCTGDWKVAPMARLRKEVMRELEQFEQEPVVLLGTRYDESSTRAANMRERGESDIEVRRGVDDKGKPAQLFISPICWWDTDEVWTYLGMARGGAIDAYSTFEETMRLYSDAMGVSCVIVAEDMSQAHKSSKACGSRFGCWGCTVSGDKDSSMENMLESDARYAYMRPLNRLRNYLVAIRWDLDKRNWLGRTVNDGWVRIMPDTFSPQTLEDLLRYCLTIDQDERDVARREGINPRFQIIDFEQLFAIDAMWSLQALHKPFHALAVWDEVVNQGIRAEVPVIPVVGRPKQLPERFLWVGRDWEDGERFGYTGLRSAVHEMAAFDTDAESGCMGTRTLKDGRQVMDVNVGPLMSFDMEGCHFLLDELPELMRRFHDVPDMSPTAAYFHYISLGVLEVKSGMQGEIDEMLRRANWKARQGVHGQVDWKTLWDRTVPREETGLPARRAARKRGDAGSRSVAHLQLLTPATPSPSQAYALAFPVIPIVTASEAAAFVQSELFAAQADALDSLVRGEESTQEDQEPSPVERMSC